MPYCEKDVNQITLNHIILWNLALQITEALIIILLNVNPRIIPWIKLSWHSCSRWDKRGWLNWFRQFLYEELSSFNLKKDSITHMHGLALYLKERLPFARETSLKNSVDSYLCFWLALLHSVSYFFFLFWSPSLLCTVFDSISSNIDEVLSINRSANVFVSGDFNVHHKDCVTYSGGLIELVNSVIIFLSQTTLLR